MSTQPSNHWPGFIRAKFIAVGDLYVLENLKREFVGQVEYTHLKVPDDAEHVVVNVRAMTEQLVKFIEFELDRAAQKRRALVDPPTIPYPPAEEEHCEGALESSVAPWLAHMLSRGW